MQLLKLGMLFFELRLSLSCFRGQSMNDVLSPQTMLESYDVLLQIDMRRAGTK